jgi:hypothetical protein
MILDCVSAGVRKKLISTEEYRSAELTQNTDLAIILR